MSPAQAGRRAFLAGGVAAAAIAGTSRAKAARRDAQLLDLCERLHVAFVDFNRLSGDFGGAPGSEAAIAAAGHAEAGLAGQVAAIAATTPAGLRAKAAALHRYLPEGWAPGDSTQDLLTASLLRDLLAIPAVLS